MPPLSLLPLTLPLPLILPLQLLEEAALAYGEENLAPSDVKGESTFFFVFRYFLFRGVGCAGGWMGRRLFTCLPQGPAVCGQMPVLLSWHHPRKLADVMRG
jgi:hypothetical protein